MLLYWLALQLLGGVADVRRGDEGGVAFWAHFGGFAVGVVLVKLFARPDRLGAHRARQYAPRRMGWR